MATVGTGRGVAAAVLLSFTAIGACRCPQQSSDSSTQDVSDDSGATDVTAHPDASDATDSSVIDTRAEVPPADLRDPLGYFLLQT
jgi:hypothetical protein